MNFMHASRTAVLAAFFALSFQLSSYAQGFSFGVVTDIQYADKSNGKVRSFKQSADKLTDAVDELNKARVSFVVQLGDIVDGQSDKAKNVADYKKIRSIYDGVSAPKYHTVGNHCTTLGRDTLASLLAADRFYYDFTSPAAPGWRFIVLDGNDGGDQGKLPWTRWSMSEGQIQWLCETLEKAKANSEKVVCFCHFPLLESIGGDHRLLNPEPVLKAIDDSGATVVAWVSGHYHPGGYAFRNGVHHVSVKGMVEAKRNAYAVFDVRKDGIVERGFGDEPSRTLPFGKAGAVERRPVAAKEISVAGTVFCDVNGNGLRDQGESGVLDVAVSDGLSVVKTGHDGAFTLKGACDPKAGRLCVFISIPSGYGASKPSSWFAVVDVDAKKGIAPVEFPLRKSSKAQENFTFVQISDTHLQSATPSTDSFLRKYVAGSDTWGFFFDKAVPAMIKAEPEAAFIVDTGDIGINETTKTPDDDAVLYRRRLDGLPVPCFFVPGNHDGAEVAKINPPYYSFNYGRFHFACLLRYPKEASEMDRQLKWLEGDLSALKPGTPTVFFSHFRFNSGIYHERLPELQRLFALCDAKAFLYGHCHGLMESKCGGSMPCASTPSFNFGGGWCVDSAGFPPECYRRVDIKGGELVASAIKSVQTKGNPLWLMCPEDLMAYDGAMYPYSNSASLWDGRARAVFMDASVCDVSSMRWSMDGGAFQDMVRSAKSGSATQGGWTSKEDARKAFAGGGRHLLTVVAEMKDGRRFERTAALLSSEEMSSAYANILPAFNSDSTAWKADGRQAIWDAKNAVSGLGRSLKVHMEPWNKAYLIDDIEVEPDGIYDLSLLVKGENVQRTSYIIFPGFSDGHLVCLPPGDYEWTRINSQFRIKPGVRRLGLCLANWSATKEGTIWIGDISLRRIK